MGPRAHVRAELALPVASAGCALEPGGVIAVFHREMKLWERKGLNLLHLIK